LANIVCRKTRAASPTGTRPCLDWTKRTHHLAGPLGVQFMSLLCERGWLRRSKDSRAVRITPEGCMEMKRHLGVDYYAL